MLPLLIILYFIYRNKYTNQTQKKSSMYKDEISECNLRDQRFTAASFECNGQAKVEPVDRQRLLV